MKRIILAITLLGTISLVACSLQASALTQPTAISTAAVLPAAPVTPTQTTVSDAVEEAAIRDLVENFGKRLQNVSLQAPDAAQEIQKQYSEFVSPSLLEGWMNTLPEAPGRMVSSPWPDRIEITALSEEGSDRYTISGFVIEVTSTEVGSSDAAVKIPVHLVVEIEQGRWLITEYIEER